MTVRFVEEAQREFLDAISEYEEARSGLGPIKPWRMRVQKRTQQLIRLTNAALVAFGAHFEADDFTGDSINDAWSLLEGET